MMLFPLLCCTLLFVPSALGHAAIWHPSMFGFNVTAQTFPYDNRPVVPLSNMPFSQWWFHGHLGYPPHPQDVFELPAGKNVTAEIACDKGATTFYPSSQGGNVQQGGSVCPNSPMSAYHTTGLSDVKGCALAIAYKSNASEVQPEDFAIFSVNQTCVWDRYTDFGVPEKMPPCPNNMCICAFFWIHSPDSGSEQNYMNGFQCRVTNSTSSVALAKSQVARRCGADPANKKPLAVPGNCTYGAKQPLYWYQAEQNNMFEGTYSPPFYNDLYNFKDGAQNDIFQDSYISIPVPGPNQTALPVLAVPGSIPTSTAMIGTLTENLPLPSGSPPSSNITASAVPTAQPASTSSQCKKKSSAFSRRHLNKRSSTPLYRVHQMAKQSRKLNPRRRSDLWRPL